MVLSGVVTAERPAGSSITYECPFRPPAWMTAAGISGSTLTDGLSKTDKIERLLHAMGGRPEVGAAEEILRVVKYCSDHPGKSGRVPQKVITGTILGRIKSVWNGWRRGEEIREARETIVAHRKSGESATGDAEPDAYVPEKLTSTQLANLAKAIRFGVINPAFLFLDPECSSIEIAEHIYDSVMGGDWAIVDRLLSLGATHYTDAVDLKEGNEPRLIKIFGGKREADEMLSQGELLALTKCCVAKGFETCTRDDLLDVVLPSILERNDVCLKTLSLNELGLFITEGQLALMGVTASEKLKEERTTARSNFQEAVEYVVENPGLLGLCPVVTTQLDVSNAVSGDRVAKQEWATEMLSFKEAGYSQSTHLSIRENSEYIRYLTWGVYDVPAMYAKAEACAWVRCSELKTAERSSGRLPPAAAGEPLIDTPKDICMNTMSAHEMVYILDLEDYNAKLAAMTPDSLILGCPLKLPAWMESAGLTADMVQEGKEEELLKKLVSLSIWASWEVARRLWELQNTCSEAETSTHSSPKRTWPTYERLVQLAAAFNSICDRERCD